jgi:XisH protein
MAKDVFHEAVKSALIFDGWAITHDPLTIPLSKRNVFIDLGAEKLIAAEKGGQQLKYLIFEPETQRIAQWID